MLDRIKEKKVVGFKQATKAIRSGIGKKLYVAENADEKIISNLIELANERGVEVIHIDTMKDLGKLCGIDVGASAMVTLKN